MPELPEVETLRRDLKDHLAGRVISKAQVREAKTVLPDPPQTFNRKVSGKQIAALDRRAKILIMTLSDGYLLIHLKMTGQLIFQPSSEANQQLIIGGHPQPGGDEDLPNKFTRLVFHFSDSSKLYFNDMRKFGWVRYYSDLQKRQELTNLGVEPLTREFTPEALQGFLKRYPRRNLKQLLLDQSLIAGLGNIYVDEALFATGLRPTRQAGRVTKVQAEKLHQAIQDILRLAIKKKGTSFRDYRRGDGRPGGFVPYLKVYNHAGDPCPNCGQPITKTFVASRGTHYCPRCQK